MEDNVKKFESYEKGSADTQLDIELQRELDAVLAAVTNGAAIIIYSSDEICPRCGNIDYSPECSCYDAK